MPSQPPVVCRRRGRRRGRRGCTSAAGSDDDPNVVDDRCGANGANLRARFDGIITPEGTPSAPSPAKFHTTTSARASNRTSSSRLTSSSTRRRPRTGHRCVSLRLCRPIQRCLGVHEKVIVWRRRRRLLRVCIDGRDGGPRGFEPRAAKIDRSPHLTWAHRRLLTQFRRLLMPPSSNARTRTAHPSSAGNMDGGSRRAGACA